MKTTLLLLSSFLMLSLVLDDSGLKTQDEGKKTENFYGSFFKVVYPESFTASPTSPTGTYPETTITYVETDEAKFLSPDKTVEFFVFSPQWGGTTSYADVFENEKITFEKTVETNSEKDGGTTTTWITFEAKDKSYFRACVLIKTENTAKAFGIKWKTQEDYDKWKPDYLKFKESLEQYAD